MKYFFFQEFFHPRGDVLLLPAGRAGTQVQAPAGVEEVPDDDAGANFFLKKRKIWLALLEINFYR